jgi:PAS domain S-box-containing protein
MKDCTILIVDDDLGLTRLIERLLGREGLSCQTALSGEEAIEWSKTRTADLFLIDLKLPDIGAQELIESLVKERQPPPFIVITGEGDERIAVDMMKRGALDYLVKDAQFLDLVPIVVQRTLSHLLATRRLRASEAGLKKEHAFSDAVLETSGALMLVVDAEGRIQRFNESCERLTGYSFKEVRGLLFSEVFLSASEQNGAEVTFKDIVSGTGPREREGYLLTRGGERRLIAWSLTTLLSDDHLSIEYIVASGMDVTERRRLEREILEITEREQKRIGQDLHDGLCQVLSGIDMLATVLHRKLLGNSPADAQAAADISGYARSANDQARMLARGLSPVELEANGLESALHELATATSKIYHLDCLFTCSDKVVGVSHDQATHLYRIAQESINNAVKHGGSKHITVSLMCQAQSMDLMIEDDGSGFDTQQMPGNGMGLRSMNHRAAMIGGTLVISRGKLGGILVTCSFPMRPQNLIPSGRQ